MAGSSSTDDAMATKAGNLPLILMVVFAASMSLPYFRWFNTTFVDLHPGLAALASGVLATAATYPALRFADEKYAFSSALLIGLLVAEFSVYGAPLEFPGPVVVAFFFFMFFMGYEEAAHLWPKEGQWA